jgi:hypothetical protein
MVVEGCKGKAVFFKVSPSLMPSHQDMVHAVFTAASDNSVTVA